jgi:cyclopropane fatty-acyl-phospholipid synthase-like methyltransferase
MEADSNEAAIAAALTLPEYPRSASYDPRWALENSMGPNVLRLTEALTQVMVLEPGMRVLDMGCGRALSSIFLAREFDVRVWSTDLWIPASENWQRIVAASLEATVMPLHAEAHALPFADGFFDAAVSLDAYHYFGTDDLYLDCFSKFVRPGGQIGIVVPGLRHELDSLPEHLVPYWHNDFWSFHSPDWWQRHWERSGRVTVRTADMIPDGWKQWLRWVDVRVQHGFRGNPEEAEMLRIDAGRNLGFSRILATKI